jgi:(p)ppGpp synthase/HD superfamily hydrolase
MLEKALELVIKYHKGQKKIKTGEPYILHLLRVMMKMDTEEEMTAALLHDMVEKTIITIKDLKKLGFSENIVKAVDAISRRKGETYAEHINRVKKNKLAIKLKIADLEDNMDIKRWTDFNDSQKLKKQQKYWLELLSIK